MNALLLALLLSLSPPAHAQAKVLPQSSQLQVLGSEALVQDAYAALAAQDWIAAARAFDALAEGGAGEPARVLQGFALYQAGLLREAESTLTPLQSLQGRHMLGLVLVDRGQQAAGVVLLLAVEQEASGGLQAAARLNLARVLLDQGKSLEARSAFEATLAQADLLGLPQLAEDARRGLDAVAALREDNQGTAAAGTTASLNAIASALRRGAMGSAQAHLSSLAAQADTPRGRVELSLAKGAIYRAQGQPDQAVKELMEALTRARTAGLAWETGQALYGLGVAHKLAGRLDLAVSFLAEAQESASAGGFQASAVEMGLELGLVSLRLGRAELAQGHLDRAETSLQGMNHPAAQARAMELRGALRAEAGDMDGATQSYQGALEWYQAKGSYGDAARVCIRLVRAAAVVDVAAAERWGEQAVALHGQFKDPLGPAHVALAMGLGRAQAQDIEGALAYFAQAAELGRASERAQGGFIADTAERNAAQALAMLGASPEAAALAAAGGLSATLAHQQELSTALQEYDQGLEAYSQGRFSDAQRRFESAASRLKELGEQAYAQQAERASVWAAYNIAVALPPEQSVVFWGEILGDAERLREEELVLRAQAEAAIAAARAGYPGARAGLLKAAVAAEAGGLAHVAARTHAELAEQGGVLDERAVAARRALALDPASSTSVYAMYVVAVDAYNADQGALALALAQEALPYAEELKAPLQGVIDATL